MQPDPTLLANVGFPHVHQGSFHNGTLPFEGKQVNSARQTFEDTEGNALTGTLLLWHASFTAVFYSTIELGKVACASKLSNSDDTG